MQYKKGLSDIVTTALIILLVAVAVAAIWAFTSPALRGTGVQFSKTQVCVANDIEILSCRGSVGFYPAKVLLRRTTGDQISLLQDLLVYATPPGETSPRVHLLKDYSASQQNNIQNFIPLSNTATIQATGICDTGNPSDVCTVNTLKTIEGVYSFNTLIIANGGTITHLPGKSLSISANDLIIEEGGSIDVTGKGFVGGLKDKDGTGPGFGESGNCWDCRGGAGAGHGGKGANSRGGPKGGVIYGESENPVTAGSGGGGGSSTTHGPGAKAGNGGGIISLNVENELLVDGSIRADGSNGFSSSPQVDAGGGGGGSGGSIKIDTYVLRGTGSITANGGDGGGGGALPTSNNKNGAGGGGGRIALKTAYKNLKGAISVDGGEGYAKGSVGTIYTEKIPDQVTLRELPEFNLGNTLLVEVGVKDTPMEQVTQSFVVATYRLPDNTFVQCKSLPIVCTYD